MRCKRAQNSLGQLQISCSTNWAMPAKMRRETSAESQLRQEMPNRPRVSFRSKKQPRVKRSTGTGIIDAVDTCTPKMMLVQTKKMFVTAEPIKKGVFAIFPTRLFYFCHLGDSRTLVNKSLFDLRPGDAKIPVPRKSPHYPARASHTENVFREMLPSGCVVNRRVSENLQALR